MFPVHIKISAREASPPLLCLKVQFRRYNHDLEILAPETLADSYESLRINDLDAICAMFPRVADVKDELVELLDLLRRYQVLSQRIQHFPDDENVSSWQAEVDTITEELGDSTLIPK